MSQHDLETWLLGHPYQRCYAYAEQDVRKFFTQKASPELEELKNTGVRHPLKSGAE